MTAAVLGQMSVAGGHSNLEEHMCTIGVPSISKPTFIDIERLLGSAFEGYLNEVPFQVPKFVFPLHLVPSFYLKEYGHLLLHITKP